MRRRRLRPIVWQQPPHGAVATLRNASEPLGMRKRDVFVSSRITVTQTRSFKLFFGPSLGDKHSLPDLHNNQREGGPGFEGRERELGGGRFREKSHFLLDKWELLWKPEP